MGRPSKLHPPHCELCSADTSASLARPSNAAQARRGLVAAFVKPSGRRPSPHSSARPTARRILTGSRSAEVDRCPPAALLRFRIHNLPLWISLIRGVHRFAPYAAQQRRGCRSPSPSEPLQPLSANDPEHIRVGLAALVAPFLDGQQPVALGQPDCSLGKPAAHARPRRDGVDTQPTGAVTCHLIPDDAQDRELPGGEPAGERGGHRAEQASRRRRSIATDRSGARWRRFGGKSVTRPSGMPTGTTASRIAALRVCSASASPCASASVTVSAAWACQMVRDRLSSCASVRASSIADRMVA